MIRYQITLIALTVSLSLRAQTEQPAPAAAPRDTVASKALGNYSEKRKYRDYKLPDAKPFASTIKANTT